MRALIQRVTEAHVTVGGETVGRTGPGMLVLACAMPTAVNVMMIAMEYDADAEAVASTVALTTLASIATVALVVAYLPAFA